MSKGITETVTEYSTSSVKKFASVVGLSFVLGAGLGVVVEGNTNEVARGKIVTVETCMDIVPHETSVNQALVDCFEAGVPSGNKVDKGDFKAEQPIEFVESYLGAQRSEAGSIEAHRIVAWSAVPIAVGAIAVSMS